MDLETFKSKFKADDYFNILDELVHSKRIKTHQDFPEWFKDYCDYNHGRYGKQTSRQLLTGMFSFALSKLGVDYWIALYNSKEENMVEVLNKKQYYATELRHMFSVEDWASLCETVFKHKHSFAYYEKVMIKRKYSNPSSILSNAFIWADTPQGQSYWRKMFHKYAEIESEISEKS